MRLLAFFLTIFVSISSLGVEGEVVVLTANDQLSSEQLTEIKARVIRKLADKTFLLHVNDPEQDDFDRIVSRVKWKSYIKESEANFEFEYNYVPNDPYYVYQWQFQEQAGDNLSVYATEAWDFSQGGAHTIIAVIDSGVDVHHTDLAGNIYANYAEANGTAGVDDDGNGYIDDIYGYNFADQNADLTDDNGHGTGIAGIIGAVGDNNFGITGINWVSSIMPVKVSKGNRGPRLAEVIEAIEYSIKRGANVLNISFGTTQNSTLLRRFMEKTQQSNVLIVTAAGNKARDIDSNRYYPASYKLENIITVCGVNEKGFRAPYSSYGKTTVGICAPSEKIVSLYPNNAVRTYTGTSFSTAFVSGAAALLWADQTGLSISEVKQRLYEHSQKKFVLKDYSVSGGIISLYHSLLELPPPIDPSNPASWDHENRNVETKHPYDNNMDDEIRVHIPGATQIAIHFEKFEFEKGYDKLSFFDGQGNSYGVWDGKHDNQYSPIITGDTLIMKITSDGSVTRFGFKSTKIAYRD